MHNPYITNNVVVVEVYESWTHVQNKHVTKRKRIQMWKCGGLHMKKVGRVDGRVNKQAFTMIIRNLGACKSIRELKTMKEENNRSPREGDKVLYPREPNKAMGMRPKLREH
jgi:hypothetical protein